jgi:5-methyltetrahydropteroyltriglutamate--homocysteine methyltransferase
VGSLLRPRRLLEARDERKRGRIASEELRAIEDDAIRHVVAKQQEAGLESITDGEFRRTFFHRLSGAARGAVVRGGLPVKFRGPGGEREFAPPRLEVVSRLERIRPLAVSEFSFLHAQVTQRTKTAKLCIPSPTMLHFRGGRRGISPEVYPDIEEFFADLARVYREEIKALAEAGCTYLQIDDTNLAYLCDPAMRERARQIAKPDALRLYTRI